MRFGDGKSSTDPEGTSKNGVKVDMGDRSPVSNGNGYSKPSNSNGSRVNRNGAGTLSPDWHGHKREEITRLIIQSLYDLGYTSSAEQLESESQCALESSEVATFRSAILDGEWAVAEKLLGSLDVQPHANMNVSQH